MALGDPLDPDDKWAAPVEDGQGRMLLEELRSELRRKRVELDATEEERHHLMRALHELEQRSRAQLRELSAQAARDRAQHAAADERAERLQQALSQREEEQRALVAERETVDIDRTRLQGALAEAVAELRGCRLQLAVAQRDLRKAQSAAAHSDEAAQRARRAAQHAREHSAAVTARERAAAAGAARALSEAPARSPEADAALRQAHAALAVYAAAKGPGLYIPPESVEGTLTELAHAVQHLQRSGAAGGQQQLQDTVDELEALRHARSVDLAAADRLEGELALLREQLAAASRRERHLRRSLGEADDQCDALRERVRETEAEREAQEAEASFSCREARGEVSSMHKQLRAAQAELEAEAERTAQAELDNGQLREENARLLELQSSMLTRCEELQRRWAAQERSWAAKLSAAERRAAGGAPAAPPPDGVPPERGGYTDRERAVVRCCFARWVQLLSERRDLQRLEQIAAGLLLGSQRSALWRAWHRLCMALPAPPGSPSSRSLDFDCGLRLRVTELEMENQELQKQLARRSR